MSKNNASYTMKKNNYFIHSLITLVLFAMISSCKKDAGEGGTSTITGKITNYNYSDRTFLIPDDTFPAVDRDVFIIYGSDGSIAGNDVKTSFDGSYEFKYLQKGKYRIYAYSEDSTENISGGWRPNVPVFQEVEITSKNQTVVVPEIIILTVK